MIRTTQQIPAHIENEMAPLKARFQDRKPTEYELREVTSQLFIKYGLQGWSFRWNRRKCALGLCSYRKKTIELSRPYYMLTGVNEILDTLLHEFAHALTKGHGHDYIWKNVTRRLGAKPNRVAKLDNEQCVKGRYVAKYSKDDDEIIGYRHRLTKSMRTSLFKFKGRRVYWFDRYTNEQITQPISRQSLQAC